MNSIIEHIITDQDIEAFQADGVICLRQAFNQPWLNKLAAGIAWNMAHPSELAHISQDEGDQGAFFGDYCNWQTIPEFYEVVVNSPAGAIAAALMEARQAIFYYEHVLVKEPGALKHTPWHHDQPYYPITGRDTCSIWITLDPIPAQASLRFVRGSHCWGKLYFPRNFDTHRNYDLTDSSRASGDLLVTSVPDIDGNPDDYEILAWDLAPGDCLVFSMATLHGAKGNTSLETSRRAIALRFFGEDVRFTERPWDISPPITGGLKPGDLMDCDLFPVVWKLP